MLTRHAREQGARTGASVPIAREPEQAPAQHLAGEVLVRDGRLAALPAISELPQVGEDDVAQHALDREARQQPVER